MTNEQQQALQRLQSDNDGNLSARAVLEAARPEASPLHGLFCWDDTEAAERYRLDQARRLIMRVTILVPKGSGPQQVRVREYHSLPSDRTKGGGAFRPIASIMSADAMRAELVRSAQADFRAFRRKYEALRELGPVFDAFETVWPEREGVAADA